MDPQTGANQRAARQHANTAPPLRKPWDSSLTDEKVKQEPTAGTAGSVAPTKQKPEGAVSFEDFKAEVSAAGLADDWTERRLQLQFQAIDENGDGWVERKEFKKVMHNLNRLTAALDDVKPEDDLISRAVGRTLETCRTAARGRGCTTTIRLATCGSSTGR